MNIEYKIWEDVIRIRRSDDGRIHMFAIPELNNNMQLPTAYVMGLIAGAGLYANNIEAIVEME